MQAAANEDRYSRLSLIPWWDQTRIAASRILVIGAGALGNEILKNLALLGARHVVIVDMDRVEMSNLSRSILYREQDLGSFKAVAAARAYREIANDASPVSVVANVTQDCGLGLFDWADVILAGLDNREARLWINRSAWKMGRPWVDGAIEGINGVARVFLPGHPPCYECTLGEVDWALIDKRMSCNLLAHASDVEGKVATTPTISSIIGGIQVQEGIKLIHNLPSLAGHGFVFEGMNHTSYRVEYTQNPDCLSHYTLESLVRLPESSEDLTVEALWNRARQDLGAKDAVLEFSRDIIWRLVCTHCAERDERFSPVGSIQYGEGACPRDGHRRSVETIHSFTGKEEWAHRKLNNLGLPLWDVFVARSADREIGYLIDGDRATVLGSMATGATAIA